MSTAPSAEPSEAIEDLLETIESRTDLQKFTEADASGEDWDLLQPLLAEKIRKQRLAQLVRAFVQYGREQTIAQWIDKHITACDMFEKNALKREIEFLVVQDRIEDLREYLFDVAKRGRKKAQKRLRWKQLGGGGYAGHAWEAFIALFQLGIVIAALSAATSSFETIVIAALGLAYSFLQDTSILNLHLTKQLATKMDAQLGAIRRLLKEELSDEEREQRHDVEQAIQESAGRYTIRLKIRTVGFSLIALASLIALLRSIL